VYSQLFCESIEVLSQDLNEENSESDFNLYKIELLKFQDVVPNFIKLLSSQEIDRANKYHFQKDKNRFIICRAFLKIFLAGYLKVSIDELIFDQDSNKKPFLSSHPSVHFNVSHSSDYALIIISKHTVGVDIEYINLNFEFNEVLSNVFNDSEMDQIQKSDNSRENFYKFWTRKESIVKAIGKGIDDDITKISVTDGTHSVPSSIVENYQHIHCYSFKLNEDYFGSVTLTHTDMPLKQMIFQPLPTFEDLKSIIG